MATATGLARNIFDKMPAEPVHAIFFTESELPVSEVTEAVCYMMRRGEIKDYICGCSRYAAWHSVYRKEITGEQFSELISNERW